MRKQIVGITSLLLTSCTGVRPSVPPPPPSTYFAQTDVLMQTLAERAKARFGSSNDFQVMVTDNAYPIGTLIRQGTSIPVDYTVCAPSTQPPLAGAPTLFPNYDLSSKVALDFGLAESVVHAIASLGVHFGATDTIALSFEDVQSQFMADNQIQQLAAQPTCRAALNSGHVWLVRGFIQGKRTFTLKRDATNNVNLGITKIGTFDLNAGTGSASVGVTDSAPTQFLQVVSMVSLPTAAGTGPVIASVPLVPPSGGGLIYVQRDQSTPASEGAAVVTSLRNASLNVENFVQPIPSAKMPSLAQVRYFNEGDKPAAENVLAIVKARYPDAILRKLSLSAPQGQMEVWLPRAATP